MKLSYSAHEKTMLFSSRVLYQMKVNKNQIGFQDEWLVILITLLVFNIKTLKNALKVLKEKKKTIISE